MTWGLEALSGEDAAIARNENRSAVNDRIPALPSDETRAFEGELGARGRTLQEAFHPAPSERFMRCGVRAGCEERTLRTPGTGR
jgi:hypothetical protein